MIARLARLHRDEHLNPSGSFLLPELGQIHAE